MKKNKSSNKSIEKMSNTDLPVDKIMRRDHLYFIPLGGSEEFGVNCNLYIHNDDWIMVDLGMGFADKQSPGFDIVLPNIDFAIENKDKIKALFITHAHEDHIGGVDHLWRYLQCPIYCSPFTAEVLRHKFKECDHTKLKDVKIYEVEPGGHLSIGDFELDFIHMAHSIPQTLSVFVSTPGGTAFHSADWNFDPTPVLGKPTDIVSLEKIGKKGVDVYIGDSTNAQHPGRAGSEADVEKGLSEVIKSCDGKVLVTIFASNISRIQSICRAAAANDRAVAVLGRSLHRMIGIALQSGYLTDMPDLLSEDDLSLVPDKNLLIIATGSQGESRAALAKISRGAWDGITFSRGDDVIFSSRPIPGNEKNIEGVKTNFAAGGTNIITQKETDHIIHVSGHPYRDEIYDMFQILKPNAVVPVHGQYAQLSGQAEIAKGCGISNIVVPNNGSVIEITTDHVKVVGHVSIGLLAVEPKRLIPMDHMAIRERKKLQYTGAIHASVALCERGRLVGQPALSMIGVIDDKQEDDLKFEDDLHDEIFGIFDDMTLEERLDDDFVHEQLRIGIRRFVFHVYGFKPVTTIHVMRV